MPMLSRLVAVFALLAMTTVVYATPTLDNVEEWLANEEIVVSTCSWDGLSDGFACGLARAAGIAQPAPSA